MYRTTPAACPPEGHLVRLLNELLDPDDAVEVERHVEECRSCQKSLEELTPYQMLVGATRRRAGSERYAPTEEFLDELRSRLPDVIEETESDTVPEIPGYTILNELGRGGMGVVYLARQIALNRLVALKVVYAAGGAAVRLRFRREAEAVARLRHPNIVQIYEVGESGGRPFLALEYVDGHTLDQIPLDDRDPRRAAELVETLARAMHAVHGLGVVHRDLKPVNILVASDGTPKITDFGLAKFADDIFDGATRTGQLIGTPSYVAPEQVVAARPGQTEISPGADVYALGAILYELLTSRPPFRAALPLETLLQVLHRDPIAPGKLNPDVPRDLETICLFCLNKNPAVRYATAADLADDLRRFLDGRPVKARPVRLPGRMLRWARRRPAAAGLILMTAVFMAAFPLGLGWLWREAELRAAAETDARVAAQDRAASLGLDHYIELCEQGSIHRGIAGMLELEPTIPEGSPLVGAVRANIKAWSQYAAILTQQLEHPAEITCLALSPDQQTILTGSVDGHVRAWDRSTGKRIGEDMLHEDRVTAIGYLPNGTAVSASEDGTIRMWDVASGRAAGNVINTEYPIKALAISPDGSTIAAAVGRSVRLWNAETGKSLLFPLRHSGIVNAIQFNDDGTRLISGSEDGTSRTWDVATGLVAGPYATHRAAVTTVAFGPNGMFASGGAAAFGARLPLLPGEETRRTTISNSFAVSSLIFDPKGRYLAVGSGERENPRGVTLYRLKFPDVEVQPLAFETVIQNLSTSADGNRLLVTGKGCPPIVWTSVHDRPVKIAFETPTEGTAAAISRDGLGAVTTGKAGNSEGWIAQVWTLPPDQAGPSVIHTTDPITQFSVAPDQRMVTIHGNRARVWDGVHPNEPRAERELTGRIVDVTWNPTPEAWTIDNGVLSVTNLLTDTKEAIAIQVDTASIAIAPKGRWIAVAHPGKPIQLYSRNNYTKSDEKHLTVASTVTSLMFSPDEQHLAGVLNLDSRTVIAIWDIKSGEPHLLNTTGGEVVRFSFSPDGSKLAAATEDKTIRIWDLATGKLLGIPMVQGTIVQDIAWSHDGMTIAIVAKSGLSRIYDVPTGRPIGPQLPRRLTGIGFAVDGDSVITIEKPYGARSWKLPSKKSL